MQNMSEDPIYHETIFIPFYTESKEAAIHTQFALILAQIGRHGKMKRIKSEKSLKEYLADKISIFMSGGSSQLLDSEGNGMSS